MWVKAPIRNTHTQYAIRNAGQNPNTQYAYAIRNTQSRSKPQYAIRLRNTQYAMWVKASIRNTQYAIRITQCRSKPQYAIRNTQYAVRNAHPCANNQIAIRNTQYAIRNTRPAANTQCAIRNTHQGGSEWVRQHAIRNTQYAMRVKTGRLRLLQYAIRNTQYANPVKPHCVIRKMLPQYAIAQYAAYGVPHISQLRALVEARGGRGSGTPLGPLSPRAHPPADAAADASRLTVTLRPRGEGSELTIMRACRPVPGYAASPVYRKLVIHQI